LFFEPAPKPEAVSGGDAGLAIRIRARRMADGIERPRAGRAPPGGGPTVRFANVPAKGVDISGKTIALDRPGSFCPPVSDNRL